MKRNAFSLLNLLAVVAIVAVLAAISVPNVLDTGTRVKVSQAKMELRRVATAVEAYSVDWDWYPLSGIRVTEIADLRVNTIHLNFTLSTPVAYLSDSNVIDPFNRTLLDLPYRTIRYGNIDESHGPTFVSLPQFYTQYLQVHGRWFALSDGPDGSYGPTTGSVGEPPNLFLVSVLYDPTNGTVSDGDIVRNARLGDVDTYYPDDVN